MKVNKEIAVFLFFIQPIRNHDDFISRSTVPAGDGHYRLLLPQDGAALLKNCGNFRQRSMLFSGGDFLRTLSSILSGEGFDESEQGESPFYIWASRTASATKSCNAGL